jgi:hypothetical protein
MPLHDWSRTPAWVFHNFHFGWAVYLKTALNFGSLPPGFVALLERTEYKFPEYHKNRIVVKRGLGRTLAVIEMVAPDNQHSEPAFNELVTRICGFIDAGIHVLLVDVFPVSAQHPADFHQAIWDRLQTKATASPTESGRFVAAYQAGTERNAFLDLLSVGDALPDMPLFLSDDTYVMVPLEASYQRAWDEMPEVIRAGVLTGEWPTPPDHD